MTTILTRILTAYAVLKAITAKPIVIQPGTIRININGRTIAESVVRYTAQQAARGSATLSGGPLR
jgi:hypothetical protein